MGLQGKRNGVEFIRIGYKGFRKYLYLELIQRYDYYFRQF